MPLSTRLIFPRELKSSDTIVERQKSGRPLTYRISQAMNNACSTPDTTHVVTQGGAVWCYDNTSKIEVVA